MQAGGWRSRCSPFDGRDGCKGLIWLRSPLAATATANEGGGDARCPPRGAAQRLAPLATVKQIPLRQNIAYWQPIIPALAARGGCRRSGLAQKCCLRLAFAFDSDMESGNGRVPEPWCRVTDQMSQAALRWPVQTASADRQMTGDATLRTKTHATRPGAVPARRWTAASSLRRQGR